MRYITPAPIMVLSRNTADTAANLLFPSRRMSRSGSGVLRDLVTTAPIRTTATAAQAIAGTVPRKPSTYPYIATIPSAIPANIMTTEGLSGRDEDASPEPLGIIPDAERSTMPRGMFRRKTQCHESMSPIIPPMVGPMMTEIPEPAAMQAMPLPRWSSGRWRTTMMGVEATMNAAPSPWMKRKEMSAPCPGDRAQPTDAKMKMMVPTTNIRRTSVRSATFPRARQSPAMGMR